MKKVPYILLALVIIAVVAYTFHATVIQGQIEVIYEEETVEEELGEEEVVDEEGTEEEMVDEEGTEEEIAVEVVVDESAEE